MEVRLIRNLPFPDALWYDVEEKLCCDARKTAR